MQILLIKNALWVGCGGFAGSAMRYLLCAWVTKSAGTGFPWGTLCVNVIGSFLIGILLNGLQGEVLYFLLVAGFCGGFTTFSAFSAETFFLLKEGAVGMALIYILTSVTICLLMVWAGWKIGMKF